MRMLQWSVVITGLLLVSDFQIAGAFGLKLYTDPAFTQCALSDDAPGVANIYVTFEAPEAGGARFRIASSTGFTGVWLSDLTPYPFIGDSQTDLSVAIQPCVQGRALVVTVTYQLFGTSTCSKLQIAPPLGGWPSALCYDCFYEPWMPCFPTTAVNVNCPAPSECDPVANEPSTWGQVKALYRN